VLQPEKGKAGAKKNFGKREEFKSMRQTGVGYTREQPSKTMILRSSEGKAVTTIGRVKPWQGHLDEKKPD